MCAPLRWNANSSPWKKQGSIKARQGGNLCRCSQIRPWRISSKQAGFSTGSSCVWSTLRHRCNITDQKLDLQHSRVGIRPPATHGVSLRCDSIKPNQRGLQLPASASSVTLQQTCIFISRISRKTHIGNFRLSFWCTNHVLAMWWGRQSISRVQPAAFWEWTRRRMRSRSCSDSSHRKHISRGREGDQAMAGRWGHLPSPTHRTSPVCISVSICVPVCLLANAGVHRSLAGCLAAVCMTLRRCTFKASFSTGAGAGLW